MQIKHSPLQINGFQIESSNFETLLRPEFPEATPDFHSHDVDIDYDQFKFDDSFMVRMSIAINKQKKLAPGYCMSCTALGFFDINTNSGINEDAQNNLLGISTLNIMIGHLRSFLADASSHGCFGRYLLPSVDMADLLEKKKVVVKKQHKTAT